MSCSVLAAVVCVYSNSKPSSQKRCLQIRQPRFPLYLGKCSTQNATSRYLKELRIRAYMIKRHALSNGNTTFCQNVLREKLPVRSRVPKNASALLENADAVSTTVNEYSNIIMSGLYDFVMDEIPLGVLVFNKEDTVFLTQYKKRVK